MTQAGAESRSRLSLTFFLCPLGLLFLLLSLSLSLSPCRCLSLSRPPVPLSGLISVSCSFLCVSFEPCDSLSVSVPVSCSKSVFLDHEARELVQRRPSISTPASCAPPPAPAPSFRRSGRAAGRHPRGPLPSAPLPGGRDPSPLTSAAPPPRAHISRGPAEERQRRPSPASAPRLPTRRLPTRRLQRGAQDLGPSRGALAGQVTTPVPSPRPGGVRGPSPPAPGGAPGEAPALEPQRLPERGIAHRWGAAPVSPRPPVPLGLNGAAGGSAPVHSRPGCRLPGRSAPRVGRMESSSSHPGLDGSRRAGRPLGQKLGNQGVRGQSLRCRIRIQVLETDFRVGLES